MHRRDPRSTRPLVPTAALLAAGLLLAAPAARAQDCDPHMALEFDGIDDFVELADPGLLPLEKFTVGAWIRVDSYGGIRRGIVTRGEDPVDDHLPWALEVWIDGTLTLEIEDGSDNNLFFGGTTFIADGEWHHVAASRAGDGTVTVFVDGAIDGVHAATPDPLDGDGAARLGNMRLNALGVPSEYGHFHGAIDEAFVYGEALDPDLVQKIFLAGVDPAYGALAMWLKLDEYSGQRCEDTPINDHHGVLGFDASVEPEDPAHVVSQAPVCDGKQAIDLNVEPPSATAGGEVQAVAWNGAPAGLVALVLTSIDGLPIFEIVLIDLFDAAGEYHLATTLPDDAPAGVTVGITAWGQTPAGKLKPSNEELLILQ